MNVLDRIGFFARVLTVLMLAALLSTVVRAVTAGSNQTLGRIWPFSLARCQSPFTPGCGGPDMAGGTLAADYGPHRQ